MRENTSHEEASRCDDPIRFGGQFHRLRETILALRAVPALYADFNLRRRRGNVFHADHHHDNAGIVFAAKRAGAKHSGPGPLRALAESLRSDSSLPRFHVHRESALAQRANGPSRWAIGSLIPHIPRANSSPGGG